MRALTARRAASVLDADVEAFERAGCRPLERPTRFRAVLEGPRGLGPVVVHLERCGRYFGGNWGMVVSTAEPVLPATERGLAARGRGVVRQHGVRFRARGRGDTGGARLAQALSGDDELGAALDRVHFEEVSVRPDGRPAIRHLGGSVVWVIFPPIVRATPLPPDQPREILRALAAFARAGQVATKTDLSSV